MKDLAFTKMHGTGNDFVMLDGIRRPVRVTPALARALCDRRFGVGADQVLVLEKSKAADFRMKIYNADGSQVEMCGNGIRCLALFARERGHTRQKSFTVETRGGVQRPAVQGTRVRVDMGEPVLDAARIPTRAVGRVLERPLSKTLGAAARAVLGRAGRTLRGTAVSMGNPHFVIFVDEAPNVPLGAWGPAIERDGFFPRRANVEFVTVENPDRAVVRVWERGSGATLACGTGACAVGVAGVLTGRLHRRVTLSLPGGALEVEWAPDNHVYLNGPAAFVYDGVWRS